MGLVIWRMQRIVMQKFPGRLGAYKQFFVQNGKIFVVRFSGLSRLGN